MVQEVRVTIEVSLDVNASMSTKDIRKFAEDNILIVIDKPNGKISNVKTAVIQVREEAEIYAETSS